MNLANRFIKPSKSQTSTFILYVKKLDDSILLYIDYEDLYNLTIKN